MGNSLKVIQASSGWIMSFAGEDGPVVGERDFLCKV